MLEIRPVSGVIGAEIHGIDLREEQPNSVWHEIAEAQDRYGVLFFRDQHLTPAQEVAFAGHFGRFDPCVDLHKLPGHPEIEIVRKEAEQKTNIGNGWHTDQAYREIPPNFTVLFSHDVPDYGGDTSFLSMAAAYDALSDGMKAMLEGLTAYHSNSPIDSRRRNGPKDDRFIIPDEPEGDHTHPMVIRHRSGKKVLYLNPGRTMHITGWTPAESKPIFDFLHNHAARPEYQCRFHWKPGSIAIWDNHQCWHYATNDYHGDRREMHRIVVLDKMFDAANADAIKAREAGLV